MNYEPHNVEEWQTQPERVRYEPTLTSLQIKLVEIQATVDYILQILSDEESENGRTTGSRRGQSQHAGDRDAKRGGGAG